MSRHNDEIDWSELGADTSEADLVNAPATAASSTEPWYTAVLRSTLPVLAQTYQQQQLTKLNIARINQGLPPMSAAAYASQYQVPAAQVQVGPTEQAQKLLMYGGGALLAILAFRSLKRR